MNIWELIRLEEGYAGTFGVLRHNKHILCFTLEPNDNENETNISSIPAQQYLLKPYSSAKYPDTYRIENVPGRINVLFHAGNTVGHTAGCILVGSAVGKLTGNRAILNSGNTFEVVLELMKEDHQNHLTIMEHY